MRERDRYMANFQTRMTYTLLKQKPVTMTLDERSVARRCARYIEKLNIQMCIHLKETSYLSQLIWIHGLFCALGASFSWKKKIQSLDKYFRPENAEANIIQLRKTIIRQLNADYQLVCEDQDSLLKSKKNSTFIEWLEDALKRLTKEQRRVANGLIVHATAINNLQHL